MRSSRKPTGFWGRVGCRHHRKRLAYDAATLDITHYRFFGAPVGEILTDFSTRKAAMTHRRDIHGQRKERLNHRIIPHSDFVGPLSISELRDSLFGADDESLQNTSNGVADE